MCISQNGRKVSCVSYGIYKAQLQPNFWHADLGCAAAGQDPLQKEPALPVTVLSFSLCETGEHRVGQTASQLATASLEPDTSPLNPITNTLQCIWISWKAKAGRLPKINRNMLFLLPLLFPQRLLRCYLRQRSSWAHGLVVCILPPAGCLYFTSSHCKGIPVASPPENEEKKIFKRTWIAIRNVSERLVFDCASSCELRSALNLLIKASRFSRLFSGTERCEAESL